MRGGHCTKAKSDLLGVGIIPAYAGNTYTTRNGISALRGSSPHTRGTLANSKTPAASMEDHPRIRGEHVRQGCRQQKGAGIIPAYAGNTRAGRATRPLWRGSSTHTRGTRISRNSCMPMGRDHPRIRGEHGGGMTKLKPCPWIIPAYAGNTAVYLGGMYVWPGSSPHTRGTLSSRAGRNAGSRDHPRIRGEHLDWLRHQVPVEGIIPAYAGNTHFISTGLSRLPGSSPHTRGTR